MALNDADLWGDRTTQQVLSFEVFLVTAQQYINTVRNGLQ